MVINDSGHKRRGRAEKKAQLRERLYDTAIRLFRRRGYDDTTVNDITAELDVAKGTFFNYFPSKEHVLAEYQRRMGAEILNSLRKGRYGTAESAVSAAVKKCAAWAQNDPAMGRVLLRTIFMSDVLQAADEENEADLTAFLLERVRAGVESGELRNGTDPFLLVSCAMGLLSASVIEWVASDCSSNVEAAVAKKVTLLFSGARANT